MRLSIHPTRRPTHHRPGPALCHASDPGPTTGPHRDEPGRAARSAGPVRQVAGYRIKRAHLVVIVAVTAGGLMLTASSAYAETTQIVALAASVDEVLTNIRNWLMGILAGLATVFASIGGVRYMMAGGDPGEVEKAKTAFRAAGIGYGLAALAPLVVTILRGIVGA